MSRSDLIVQNSTWQNVRVDLQQVKEAIATKNSGTGNPLYTYPYMDGANNATSKLRVRNALDNAYVDYFDTALPNQSARVGTSRSLVASFTGNNMPSTYQVTLPSNIDAFHYAIEATMPDTDNSGFFLTIFTANDSGGASDAIIEYYNQTNPLVTAHPAQAPASGVSKYLYLWSFTPANVNTLSSTGIVYRNPNGRLSLESSTFEISGEVRATDATAWSIPYTFNLDSMVVRAYNYSRTTLKALPSTFRMSFYA